jgi:hypothetical protein
VNCPRQPQNFEHGEQRFTADFGDTTISILLNPDSAVEREEMSKEQTFRSEDMPFGIANGKSQIPNQFQI